jgi:hypothetical protein
MCLKQAFLYRNENSDNKKGTIRSCRLFISSQVLELSRFELSHCRPVRPKTYQLATHAMNARTQLIGGDEQHADNHGWEPKPNPRSNRNRI